MVYAKDRPILNEDHRKHEIILFHNSTNAGVDTVGQCAITVADSPLSLTQIFECFPTSDYMFRNSK